MKCCSCNSSGRCVQCSCVRASRRCYNCNPGQHNRCNNAVHSGTRPASASQPTNTSTNFSVCRRASLPCSLLPLALSSSSSSSSSSLERTASNTPGARRDAGVNNLRKGASASAIKPRSVERENTVSTTPGVGSRTSMFCPDKTRKVPSSGGLVQGSFEKTVNDRNIGTGLAPLSAGVETTSPTAAIGRRAEQDDSAGVQDAPAVDHVTVAPHVRNGKVDTVNRDHRSGKGDSSGENDEMGKCCSCNAKGIWSKCRCATNHTFCVNCAPGGRQRCQNGGNRAPFRTA